MSIKHMKPGNRAVILSLQFESSHERNKLMALGVMPGATVHLIQRFPSYVISVGYTQLAIDKETAQKVIVKEE